MTYRHLHSVYLLFYQNRMPLGLTFSVMVQNERYKNVARVSLPLMGDYNFSKVLLNIYE